MVDNSQSGHATKNHETNAYSRFNYTKTNSMARYCSITKIVNKCNGDESCDKATLLEITFLRTYPKKTIQKIGKIDVHLFLFRIMKSGNSLNNVPYYAACYPFLQCLEILPRVQ